MGLSYYFTTSFYYDRKDTDSALNDFWYLDLRRTLGKEVRGALEKQLPNFEKALDQISNSREKYPNITESELASRKRFVFDSKTTLKGTFIRLNILSMTYTKLFVKMRFL